MRVARALAGVLFAAVLSGCATEQTEPRDLSPIRFFREYVVVEPSREEVRVSGTYHFRNDTDEPVEQGIEYPFPVDRFHLYPGTIRVSEVDDGELRPMGFTRRRESVRWLMRFEPRQEKIVRVDYWQDIHDASATYIVSSTQKWERAIEVAEFEFRIPPEIRDAGFSFTPDREEASGDTAVYYMRRENFLPDEDLTITWHRQAPG